jgi:hypothetical protein
VDRAHDRAENLRRGLASGGGRECWRKRGDVRSSRISKGLPDAIPKVLPTLRHPGTGFILVELESDDQAEVGSALVFVELEGRDLAG